MQRSEILTRLCDFLKVNIDKVNEQTPLTDLAADSFVLIEAVVELQETLSIHFVQEDLDGINTVGQLLDLCQTKMA